MSSLDSDEHRCAQVLLNAQARFAACRVAEEAMRKNALEDYIFMGGRMPTKWEKRRYRIKEFFRRFYVAWRVICGDDLESLL